MLRMFSVYFIVVTHSSSLCSRVPGLKIKTNDGHPSEPVVRPKDRIAPIREQIETTLIDHHWEDLIDVSNHTGCLVSKLTGSRQNPY